jgi:hypothetical protein
MVVLLMGMEQSSLVGDGRHRAHQHLSICSLCRPLGKWWTESIRLEQVGTSAIAGLEHSVCLSCRQDGSTVHWETLPGGIFYPYNLGTTAIHEFGHWLG